MVHLWIRNAGPFGQPGVRQPTPGGDARLPTAVSPTDMPVDPDEPVYCVCRRVSYGEMVQCDSPTCPFEWFHFECVGLTQGPKGKWYCPQCRGTSRTTPAGHFAH